jgi:hypothetical protein
MSDRLPIQLSDLPVREKDEGAFLTVDFYDNRSNDKYNECDLVISTNPDYSAYEMQVEVSDENNGIQTFHTNRIAIRISGGWEKINFMQSLRTILDADDVLDLIDKGSKYDS